MLVFCEECGKQYRIDATKIKADQVTFKCKACAHLITVHRPRGSDSESQAAPGGRDAAESPSTSGIQAPAAAAADAAGTAKAGFRFGLIAKVVGLMLLVSLLPLLTFWSITFKQNSSRIRRDTEMLASQITLGLAGHVDEWIDKNARVLKALANMEDIRSMDGVRQERLLTAVQKEYPWMYLVFTTDIQGMNIARSDGKFLKDYSDRQYVKDIVGGKAFTWQTLIGKTSKKPAVVLAVPIREEGRLVGVMANAMQIDDISRRIATWKRGRSGFAFLVDEKGKVVAHQVKDFVVSQKNLSAHPLVAAFQDDRSGTLYFKDQSGASQIGNVRGTRYGWALAIQQNEREAFDILYRERRFAYLLLALTLAGVILIAFLAGRSIVRPIRRLTEAADRISVGELDVEIEVRSKDEIGALGDAIARMQDSIRLSLERLRRRRS